MIRKALRLVVPAILLAVLALKFDLGEAIRNLAQVSPIWVVTSLAAFAAMLALRAKRWIVILHWLGLDVPPAKALLSFALGLASSAFVGDALGSFGRIYDLRDNERSSMVVGYAVVFDKAYEILVLLALVPLGALVVPSLPVRISPAFALLSVAVVVAGLVVLLSPRRIGRLGSLLHIRRIENLKGLGAVLGLSEHGAIFLLSVAARATQFLFVWLLSRGLSIELSYLEMSAVMTFVGIAVLVPASINGLGLRDVTMASLFSLIGETPQSALSLSLGIFLITSAFRLAAGLIWSAKASPARAER